ncbi:MAG: radical SAM protein [Clostridiales bacterium]|nr:radical SAM protein [Clostridiales bacterium]
MKKHRLSWIDEFIGRIKPYVYMRLKDNVLIRMPNEAFKLNTTGARVIHHILGGGSVLDFLKARKDFPETESQLERFFVDFSLVWNDDICENYDTPAIHRTEFSLGYIEFPVLSEVALTYVCNIKCKFCYGGCTPTDSGRVLDLDGFKKVLDKIRYEAEVPSVSFTGGEPTVSKDLPELVRYASKNNGMRVNLITNGTLITPKLAKGLREAGLSSAQVSIEAPTADAHDSITGVPGSHAASIRGLQALAAEGVTVHPHFTICSLNRDYIMDYPAFAKEIGVERFSANLIIPAGRGDDKSLQVSYTEIGGMVIDLKSMAQSTGVEFMWYSPTPVCLFNPITSGFGNKGCSACEGLLSLDPQGNVLPCSSWSEPIGNILEEGFHAVWSKKRSQWIRAKESAPDECKACKDFALCQGACPLYFNVHGVDELHRSWLSMSLTEKEVI